MDRRQWEEDIVAWRRQLHQWPELSGQERQTAAFVAEKLRGFGLEVQEGINGYGLVGLLRGAAAKKCAALRADMDALPIQEENDWAYASARPGVMHACGHDAHMAIVLGAAALLATEPPAGSVKFIFQPHEEKKPGGAGGMIAAGVLEDPYVDGLFATHVLNSYPLGSFGLAAGAVMAASDDFILTVHGESSHASAPERGVDPIVIAASLVSAAQTIVSRRVAPQQPAVLSFGSIHGGSAHNIIPAAVELTGTARSFDPAVRSQLLDELEALAQGLAATMGGRAELKRIPGYPPLVNDGAMVERLRTALAAIPGANALPVPAPPLGGEDFAFFAAARPTAFMFTGTGSVACQAAWHQPCFQLEEAALPLAARVLAQAARGLAGEDR